MYSQTLGGGLAINIYGFPYGASNSVRIFEHIISSGNYRGNYG